MEEEIMVTLFVIASSDFNYLMVTRRQYEELNQWFKTGKGRAFEFQARPRGYEGRVTVTIARSHLVGITAPVA